MDCRSSVRLLVVNETEKRSVESRFVIGEKVGNATIVAGFVTRNRLGVRVTSGNFPDCLDRLFTLETSSFKLSQWKVLEMSVSSWNFQRRANLKNV